MKTTTKNKQKQKTIQKQNGYQRVKTDAEAAGKCYLNFMCMQKLWLGFRAQNIVTYRLALCFPANGSEEMMKVTQFIRQLKVHKPWNINGRMW